MIGLVDNSLMRDSARLITMLTSIPTIVVHLILTGKLTKLKVCACYFPRTLTDNQKFTRSAQEKHFTVRWPAIFSWFVSVRLLAASEGKSVIKGKIRDQIATIHKDSTNGTEAIPTEKFERRS